MRKCENWLDTYMLYTEQSEAPDNYHLWCGISAIAAALRRQVWIDMGHFDVYPNMYIVLVGPPATRKGAAINIATRIMSKVGDIKVGSDAVTREALIQAIKQSENSSEMNGKIYLHSSLMLVSKELSVFLGNNNFELLSLLTDLYDAHDRWVYRTKHEGTDELNGVWLHLLAGTTPLWLTGSVPMNAIGGGFTSRVIFVVEHHKRKNTAIPELTDDEISLRRDLQYDLEQISMIKGKFSFSKEGKKWFKDWYDNKVDALSQDPRFQGYADRKHIHLLKVAMAIAASFEDKLVLEAQHLQMALQMLEQLEENMTDAFGAVGRNILAPDIDTVLQYIQDNGKLSRDQLLRSVWRDVNTRDVEKVLSILQDMKLIRRTADGGIIYYEMYKKEV